MQLIALRRYHLSRSSRCSSAAAAAAAAVALSPHCPPPPPHHLHLATTTKAYSSRCKRLHAVDLHTGREANNHRGCVCNIKQRWRVRGVGEGRGMVWWCDERNASEDQQACEGSINGAEDHGRGPWTRRKTAHSNKDLSVCIISESFRFIWKSGDSRSTVKSRRVFFLHRWVAGTADRLLALCVPIVRCGTILIVYYTWTLLSKMILRR